MALMGDILELIQADALAKGMQQIEKVELIVGEVANAMPDALQMAFAIYRDQNPLFLHKNAQLVIHSEEAKAVCVLCGIEYRPQQKIALCPECQIPSGKLVSGETLQVLSYEGSFTNESNIENRRPN